MSTIQQEQKQKPIDSLSISDMGNYISPSSVKENFNNQPKTLIKTPYGVDTVENIQYELSPEGLEESYKRIDSLYSGISNKFAARDKSKDSIPKGLLRGIGGAVQGAGAFAEENITAPIASGFGNIRSTLSRNNAENAWNTYKTRHSQEKLNKVMNFLQQADPSVVSNHYNMFTMSDAVGTAKKQAERLGVELDDEDLDIISNYAKLERERANDYYWNSINKYIQEGWNDENIANTNSSLQMLAKEMGSVAEQVALDATVMSIAPAGKLAMFGTVFYRQFDQKRVQALDRGWSNDKANAWGTLYGAIEAFTELIAMEKFVAPLASMNSNLANLVTQRALPEMFQEGVQTGAELSLDMLNNLGYGSFKDFDDVKDLISQTAYAMLIGGLVGGVMGGAEIALQGKDLRTDILQEQFKQLVYEGAKVQEQTQEQGPKYLENTSVPLLTFDDIAYDANERIAREQKDRAERFNTNIRNFIKSKIKKKTGKAATEKQINNILRAAYRGANNTEVQSSFAVSLSNLVDSVISTTSTNNELAQANLKDWSQQLEMRPDIKEKVSTALKNVVSEEDLDKTSEKLSLVLDSLRNDFSQVMSEEQTEMMSNFLLNTIFPRLVSSDLSAEQIYDSIRPTVINLVRARLSGTKGVNVQSVLDDFTKVNNTNSPNSINSVAVDAQVAWDNLTRATENDYQKETGKSNKQTKDDLVKNANDFFYNDGLKHDPQQTKYALLNEAYALKKIYQEAGMLSELNEEDWITVAILKNKGYLPSEIVSLYGEDASTANVDFENARVKLYPALNSEEIKRLNRVLKISNKQTVQKGGAYTPFINTIVVGTDSPRATGLHEATHYSVYQTIYMAKEMRDMGFPISKAANDFLNIAEKICKDKNGLAPTNAQFQETIADMVVEFYKEGRIYDNPDATGSLVEITNQTEAKAILFMDQQQSTQETTKDRSAQALQQKSETTARSSTQSLYQDLSTQQKNKLKRAFKSVLLADNSSYAGKLKNAQKIRDLAYSDKDPRLLRDELFKVATSIDAQILGGNFLAADLVNSGLESRVGFISESIDNLVDTETDENQVKLLSVRNDVNSGKYESALDTLGKMIKEKQSKGELTDELSTIHKEIVEAAVPLTPAQNTNLTIMALKTAQALRITAAAQIFKEQQSSLRGGKNLDLSVESLYSGEQPDTQVKDVVISDEFGTDRFSNTKIAMQDFSVKEHIQQLKVQARNCKDIKEWAKFHFISTYRTLTNFDPLLGRLSRELMQEYGTRLQGLLDLYGNFQEKMSKACKDNNITRAEYETNFTFNLLNYGRRKQATEFVQRIMGDEGVEMLNNVYKSLENLKTELNKCGIVVNDIKDFFPRKVKNYEKFLAHINMHPRHPLYKAIQEARANGATEQELIDTVDAVFYAAQQWERGKISSLQQRTVKYIKLEDIPYYEDPFDALAKYAEDISRTIMMRKMFGYTKKGKTGEIILVKQASLNPQQWEQLKKDAYDEVLKQSVINEAYNAYLPELNNVNTEEELNAFLKKFGIRKQAIEDRVAQKSGGLLDLDAYLDFLYTDYIDIDFANSLKKNNRFLNDVKVRTEDYVKRLQNLETDEQQMYGQLGAVILRKLENPNTPKAEVDSVINAIQAFSQRTLGNNTAFESLRELNTLAAISSNIYAGLSQLLEYGPIIKRFGFKNAMIATYRALTSEKDFNLREIGIPELYESIRSRNKSVLSRLNRFALRLIGFAQMDERMKKTAAFSGVQRLQQGLMSKVGSPEYNWAMSMLERYYSFTPEMDRLANGRYSKQLADAAQALINGELDNPEVKFVMFNIISDQQPINALEVPPGYNKAGSVGKLFYQFQTPAIKQFELISNDIIQNYKDVDKNGNPIINWKKGTVNALHWAIVLSTVGATKEFIERLLKGQEPPKLSSAMIFGVTQYMFLNQYIWDKAQQEGIWSALMLSFMPNFAVLDAAYKDFFHVGLGAGELKDSKLLSLMPVIGKAWWWICGGGRKFLERSKQTLDDDDENIFQEAQDTINSLGDKLSLV